MAPSHIDAAAGERAFAVAERLAIRRLFEDEMKPAADRRGDGPGRQTAVLLRQRAERLNSIGPAVSIAIDPHEVGATKRNARHSLGEHTPPFEPALWAGADGLPAPYDGLLP